MTGKVTECKILNLPRQLIPPKTTNVTIRKSGPRRRVIYREKEGGVVDSLQQMQGWINRQEIEKQRAGTAWCMPMWGEGPFENQVWSIEARKVETGSFLWANVFIV